MDYHQEVHSLANHIYRHQEANLLKRQYIFGDWNEIKVVISVILQPDTLFWSENTDAVGQYTRGTHISLSFS